VQAQGYAGFRDSNTDLMLHRIEAATDKLIPTTPEDEEKLSGGPADFSMEDSPTCKFTKYVLQLCACLPGGCCCCSQRLSFVCALLLLQNR